MLYNHIKQSSSLIQIKLDLLIMTLEILNPRIFKQNKLINIFHYRSQHNFRNIQRTKTSIFLQSIKEIYLIQYYINQYSIQAIAYYALKKINTTQHCYLKNAFIKKYYYYYHCSMNHYVTLSYYKNCKNIQKIFLENIYLISKMPKKTSIYFLINYLIHA